MFMQCIGSCFACSKVITFDPHKVPSLTIDGIREPICSSCHARWNEIHRTSKGLEPIALDPNAYGYAEEPTSDLD